MTPEVSNADTAEAFSTGLLHFINCELPHLDRRGREWPPVQADTPLFASGLLDSLSILHLISAIEALTDRRIPDELVVMKHFQTVEAIAVTFWKSQNPPI